MKRIVIFLFVVIMMLGVGVKAQDGVSNVLMQKQGFYEARLELESMLAGDEPLDYERAVFVMENAYRGNSISYEAYENVLDFHTENIRLLAEANRDSVIDDLPKDMFETEEDKYARYEKLLFNWAIYHYMTDTTRLNQNEQEFLHLPYQYSYADPMGVLDWRNTQVLSLLENKAGNCYALVNLYMIFSKRLGTDARIGTAPGHMFVMHDGMDGREYFVELANGSFPGTGTIMTLSYSTLESVKEGIAMRELDEKRAVGMCLVYLGKGYEYKFETKIDGFIYDCAETALEYDELNLNAMLLKAKVLEERLWGTEKNVSQLQNENGFKEYEALIVSLYEKGYREMPLDMKNLIVKGLQKDDGGIILKDHTPRAFQTIDDENIRYATLSWGLFDEMHAQKDVEKYGRALLDTKTKKIVELVEHDVLYNAYPLDVGVFAMSVDPLTKGFPMLTPYQFASNTPIQAIDLEGLEAYVIIRANADGSQGHTMILVQNFKKVKDKAGDVYYEPNGFLMYENNVWNGNTEKVAKGSNNDIRFAKYKGSLTKKEAMIYANAANAEGVIMISNPALKDRYTEDEIKTELKIKSTVLKIAFDVETGSFDIEKYNCAGFVSQVLGRVGILKNGEQVGLEEKNGFSVYTPNQIFQDLREIVNQRANDSNYKVLKGNSKKDIKISVKLLLSLMFILNIGLLDLFGGSPQPLLSICKITTKDNKEHYGILPVYTPLWSTYACDKILIRDYVNYNDYDTILNIDSYFYSYEYVEDNSQSFIVFKSFCNGNYDSLCTDTIFVSNPSLQLLRLDLYYYGHLMKESVINFGDGYLILDSIEVYNKYNSSKSINIFSALDDRGYWIDSLSIMSFPITEIKQIEIVRNICDERIPKELLVNTNRNRVIKYETSYKKRNNTLLLIVVRIRISGISFIRIN